MRTMLLFAAVLLVPTVARADGLLYQLPPDGSWATFDMTLTFNPDTDNERKLKGWSKMSSVGTATENGEPCRWIEINLTFNDDNQDRTIISKALIPEKHLKEGEPAYQHVVRGWFKDPDDPEPRDLKEELQQNPGILAVFLCGPLQDAKKLEPETVESELGKLECHGVRGYTTYMQGDNKNTVTLEVRKHKKAPFGVVSCRIKNEIEQNGQRMGNVRAVLKLSGHGKTALSDLPKYK